MDSITYINGKRETFQDYHSFREMCDVLRQTQQHFVSYYDRHGHTHVCVYVCVGNNVKCCGVFRAVKNDIADLGDYEACHQAAGIVRDVRWDEFLGWSI